jgi:hypothetical protein
MILSRRLHSEEVILIAKVLAVLYTDFIITFMEKNKKITIDDLAQMVGRGFNDMGEMINEVRRDLSGEIGLVKQDLGSMKQDINLLKQGQERIEMRLNNVVYRTELDAVLDRVQVLELQMKTVLKKS